MIRNKFGVFSLLAVVLIWFVQSALASGGGSLMINEIGWAGTGASPSDEWYEVKNTGDTPINTEGWYLEMIREDGAVYTATLPSTIVQPNTIALFERTDDNTVSNIPADGIHGAGGTGGSLTGIFINSNFITLSLFNADSQIVQVISAEDGDWPAGSSSPRASMQWLDGDWVTANQAGTGLDANGSPVIGTPGEENFISGNPDTCHAMPNGWDYEVELILFEDWSTQMQVHLTADLWGVAPDGSLIATEGYGEVVWVTAGNGQWVAGVVVVDEETSPECTDAMQMLVDVTENYLQQGEFVDNACVYLMCSDGTNYVNWMDGLLDFQKSGLHSTHLPYVANGE